MFKYSQVVDIMRVNVDKVLERDQKLSELDDRAGELQMSFHCIITCLWGGQLLTVQRLDYSISAQYASQI